MLDYGVMSPTFKPFARSLRAIQQNPWLTHYTLEAELEARAEKLMCWQLALPKAFPQPPPAKKAPDPNSKTQRKKNEKAAQRQAAQ